MAYLRYKKRITLTWNKLSIFELRGEKVGAVCLVRNINVDQQLLERVMLCYVSEPMVRVS